jgi:hypothetical protein
MSKSVVGGEEIVDVGLGIDLLGSHVTALLSKKYRFQSGCRSSRVRRPPDEKSISEEEDIDDVDSRIVLEDSHSDVGWFVVVGFVDLLLLLLLLLLDLSMESFE